MAKFSLWGDGDGDGDGDEEDDVGPSCPVSKRPRFDSSEETEAPQREQQEYNQTDDEDDVSLVFPSIRRRAQEEHDQIDDEDDDLPFSDNNRRELRMEDGGEEEKSELNGDSISAGANQKDPYSLPTDTGCSISIFLTDPDVLDCSICFEPLTIPVFQCENGHIACSSCCSKLRNKCPSCSWPIGYNRCRAIEKVLESIKIACQNKQHGCKEMVSYSKKKDHEKACAYEPCFCPLTSCNFVSSAKQLYQHFSGQHKDSAVPFHYNCTFTVTLNVTNKFLILQERNNGVLFILKNELEILGNLVSISSIAPCSFGELLYDLLAKHEGNTLGIKSFTKCTQGQVDKLSPSVYLLIPPDFFGSSGQLKLDIYIGTNNASPACSERSIEAASQELTSAFRVVNNFKF